MVRDEYNRNASECVDEREEEAVDEVVMVTGTEVVYSCHQLYQYLAELLLTIASNACALEKIKQQSHSLNLISHQNATIAFEQVGYYYGCFSLNNHISAFIV